MNIFSSFKLVLELLESKKKIPFLIILFLINSIVEVFGISAIAWFLVLATDPIKTNSEIFIFISDFLDISDTRIVMPIIALILLVVIILKSTLSIFTNRYIYRYSFNQGAIIRKRLLEKYLNLSYEDWTSKPMSEYIQSVLNLPVQYSQNILLSTVRLFSEGVVFIAISIFIILIDGFAFLMFSSIMLILYVSFNIIFKKRSSIYGKKINDESRVIISTITESLTGFAEIRLKNIENFFLKRLLKSAKEFSSAAAKFEIINTIPRYLIEVSILFFIVLYLVSFSFFVLKPMDSVFYTLGVLGAASIRIAPSANLILSAINQIRFGGDTLLILKKALSGPSSYANSGLCNIDRDSSIESIDINSLSFRYLSSDSNTIEDISLKIEVGNVIGIKGKTGSGKSTLLALILGLLNPSSGSIKFNYKNSNSFLSTDCIQPASYIPQKPFIINDSVINNIAIGEDDININKIHVQAALKMASLEDEISINNLSLGDGGNTISGGQRQRLVIARAFYEENKFIVLDEPTSALDSETRDTIIHEIQSLKEKAIIIIVSHDPSILLICDTVYEIDNGQLSKINE
jgi:ABC-type bacteriocin/lantibiotic exporter with double-glycine peptidase domain